MDCGSTIFIFLAFFQATCGQSVTVTGPSAIEQGRNTELICSGGASPYVFSWTDNSVIPSIIIFNAGQVSYPPENTKYSNFRVTEDGAGTSTMMIENTEIEDEGRYQCLEGQAIDEATFTVEVRYTLELSVASPLENGMTYTATCEALNGRPDLPITWMLGDSGAPCVPVETTPVDEQGLFSKNSTCTFQADSANDGETLRCIISGHQVAGLDRENTTTLVIHSAPRTGIITVDFEVQDPNLRLRVSCVIAPADQPNPSITNYYIISNGTMIHLPDTGNNYVDVPRPNFATDFLCVAGNYLGNTTSEATYDPSSPTTLPTPTDAVTPPMSGDGKNNTKGGLSGPKRPSAAAIGGGVAGAIVVIIIVIVIIYFVKREKPGPSGASSTKKHGSSTVGTSNGSEKDKIKPVAAPRDQGSIQHTTDNPGQAEYAMVDRKKPGGGDMPDTRGPGQKEPPQGMLYADLDLSASAGHTEKKVPQNKDDVVVYSSILV